MISERFEYLFILLLLASTGLSLTWDGLTRVLRQAHFLPTLLIFFAYCLGIEILALRLGWWSFTAEKVIGLYLWIIPVEELLLFFVFAIITLSAWEQIRNEAD